MDFDTVIVRIESGTLARLDFVNPTLRHGIVVYDGVAERCVRLQPLYDETDIAEAIRLVREGKLNEAWRGLSDWANTVAAGLAQVGRAAESFIEPCFAFRAAHQGDPARLLVDIQEARPQIDAMKEALRGALFALDQAGHVCERAIEIIHAEPAAHDGHHQQPLSASGVAVVQQRGAAL